MQGFESVAHELEQKRLHLEQELNDVRGRTAEIEADLERVHEAMAALTGAKKKAKSRTRTRKTAPSVADLRQHIAHVRGQNPFADAGQLERAVREKVQQGGGSLSGFKTLFAEALLTSPGSETPHSGPSVHQGFALGTTLPHEDHGGDQAA